MEGLAAASSVAGVLSLAGQTIDGVLKLQSFFKEVSSASRTMERFLYDINLLIKTIEDVRSLLSSISETLNTAGTDLKIVALEIQLQDCSKDIYQWLRIWSDHHPGFSTGTKASFKKFWIAANKTGMLGISQDIKGHRQSLVASLSVLGRYVSLVSMQLVSYITLEL
jgi:UDP-N-acetylglucosamine enolpyruvyl transferase